MSRFPGPKVVAGCFLVLTTTSGLGFYGLAVYLNVFSRELHWDVSSISLATTLFFVVTGVFGLFAAGLIARHDVRIVIVGGGITGGVALALLGQVQERWHLFVVYALFGIGFAAAGLVPATTVVTRWYHTRRSMALAIASTGLSVGGIAMTPFAKALLDRVSLESGMALLGLVWVAGTVPFALVLVKPDPAALGWAPDGARLDAGTPPTALGGTPFSEAQASRFFVGITIAYVFALGSQVGAIQQLVKLVEERTDPGTAALATVFLAATSVIARLLGGRIVSHLPMARFTALLAVVQAAALTMLAFAESTVPLFAAIILFGATIGNILMLQPLLISQRFGVVDYPRIFGRSQFFTMFGVAGGPLLLGWLYDSTGGYRTPYLVGAACSFTGGIVFMWAGPATEPATVGAGPLLATVGER